MLYGWQNARQKKRQYFFAKSESYGIIDTKGGIPMNLEELKRKMDKEHYIYDDTLSTVLYVACSWAGRF